MAFFGKSVVPEESALLGSIRLVVVGEPLVGKTALTELIANGQPSKASRSTAGCHIHVKLVDTCGSQAGNGAPRRFFVELWDVSGQPKYEQLRSVFYKQINGVIFVYDLTNRKTLARLPKWAAEIAQYGSFVAPLADEVAVRNIGGLPVPVLVVGNKSDRLRHGGADTLSSMINSACSQVLSSSVCSSWWRRSFAGLRGRKAPSESNIGADLVMEQHMKGLTASAAAGQLDWELVNRYLAALWERRYKPLSGSAQQEFMQRSVSFGGGLAGLGSVGAGVGAGCGVEDHQDRADDDWV
ncbi:P-loop containing nucleoside triphosphate hydrolase protein [Scenedesmus sp. NREL 46B-D3]|nr:P-loop containing nucleoside triphosphate hydrolase protein [Scenedesmus sp. NREL 46B-D3]